MKNIYTVIAIAMALVFTSCSEDEVTENLTGSNDVSIEFDNSFNGDDLLLGSSFYTNGNGEQVQISAFDYIVSNFVLVTEDGEEYTYPKEDSYFIISEGGGDKTKVIDVVLKDIPAGKYTKIKFGIGIDQERYLEGQAAQEDFWTEAESYNMTWSWTAGYKFVVQEGVYKSDTQTDETPFALHIASRGSSIDLYKEVELSMDTAIVSNNVAPQVHIVTDASKMLDATHQLLLEEKATIMGGDEAGLVAENNVAMFSVDHVHNGDSH